MDACPECRDEVNKFTSSVDNATAGAASDGGFGRPPLATRDLIMIMIAMIIQAFYDTLIRLLARCECAKHMHYERHKTTLNIINTLQPSVGLLALGATAVLYARFLTRIPSHFRLCSRTPTRTATPHSRICPHGIAHRPEISLHTVSRLLPDHRCHFDRPEQGRRQ